MRHGSVREDLIHDPMCFERGVPVRSDKCDWIIGALRHHGVPGGGDSLLDVDHDVMRHVSCV